NVSKRRYGLRNRPTSLENGCEDSDDNPVGNMDKHCNGSDDGGILGDKNEDCDSLSDRTKVGTCLLSAVDGLTLKKGD
ncbi:hypothetical protein H633G_11639, partial [Metarhizium anisopliae BRIP 53284]